MKLEWNSGGGYKKEKGKEEMEDRFLLKCVIWMNIYENFLWLSQISIIQIFMNIHRMPNIQWVPCSSHIAWN